MWTDKGKDITKNDRVKRVWFSGRTQPSSACAKAAADKARLRYGFAPVPRRVRGAQNPMWFWAIPSYYKYKRVWFSGRM